MDFNLSPELLSLMQQAQVTPPTISRSMIEYSLTRYGLFAFGTVYQIVVLWLMLQLGVVAQLQRRVEAWSSRGVVQCVAFFVLFFGLLSLLRAPLSLYSGYFLEHQFALSNQSLAEWLQEWLKMVVISVSLSTIGASILVLSIRRFARRWWLIVASSVSALVVLFVFLMPWVIDPLFNRFYPMPESPSRTAVMETVEKAGLRDAPLLVVDKSKQTEKLNAYVTGLGASARIVLWDNIIRKLPPGPLASVVAHEAGHYVHAHVIKGVTLSCLTVFAGLWLLSKFADRLVAALPKRWGVRSKSDFSFVPVLALLGAASGLIFAPVENAISRHFETEADQFAIDITGNRPDVARAMVALSEKNLSLPNPPSIVEFWFFSHPSLERRIRHALEK